MQCVKKNAYILSLLILFYNISKISKIINIVKELIQRLDFDNYIFENKIKIVKRN